VHWKVSQKHLGSSRNEYLQSHSHLSCVAASVPHSAFKEMQLGKLPSEYASLRNPFVPDEHVSHSIIFRVLYCSITFHEQQVERKRKPSRGRGGHAIRRNRPSQARGRQVNFVLPQIISPLFQNTQITYPSRVHVRAKCHTIERLRLKNNCRRSPRNRISMLAS